MHPELIQQIVRERTARLQRDAHRYGHAREAHIRPRQPVRTAIELRLSACRRGLECLARRREAAGPSTE